MGAGGLENRGGCFGMPESSFRSLSGEKSRLSFVKVAVTFSAAWLLAVFHHAVVIMSSRASEAET